VNVNGQVIVVTGCEGLSLGAIATKARWQTGYGEIPFDCWEIRTDNGILLNPSSRPGAIDMIFVSRLAAIGG